jgi:hypothetical protein
MPAEETMSKTTVHRNTPAEFAVSTAARGSTRARLLALNGIFLGGDESHLLTCP